MGDANLPLIFGGLLVGAVIIKYGIDNAKTAVASGLSAPASSSPGSSSPGTSPSTTPGSVPSGPAPAGANPVVVQAGRLLMAHGLSRTAAAGVLGNALQESSWDPAAVGTGGGGLWGFTSGPISLASLQAYAAAHGVSWTDVTIQVEFLLAHLSASDISALNAQPTPAAAAIWFQNNWEHPAPATENQANRVAGAQQAYNWL